MQIPLLNQRKDNIKSVKFQHFDWRFDSPLERTVGGQANRTHSAFATILLGLVQGPKRHRHPCRAEERLARYDLTRKKTCDFSAYMVRLTKKRKNSLRSLFLSWEI